MCVSLHPISARTASLTSLWLAAQEALGIMAEHLGGAALAQYQEEINALAEAGQRANALGKGGLSGQTPAELEGVDAEALVEEVGADTSARL